MTAPTTDGTDGQYFWCLKHSRVEREDGCAAKDRIGPFASAAEAERGLETMHAREKSKEAEDEAWRG